MRHNAGHTAATLLILLLALRAPRQCDGQTTIAVPAVTCPASTAQLGSQTFTVPCSLEQYFTLSTASSYLSATSPPYMGVNRRERRSAQPSGPHAPARPLGSICCGRAHLGLPA